MPVAKALLQNTVLCMFWAPCWHEKTMISQVNNDNAIDNVLATYSPTYPLAFNETLQVVISIELEKILQQQRADEFVNLLLFINLTWSDNRLAWNSTDNRLNTIFLPANNIWHPDLQTVEQWKCGIFQCITAIIASRLRGNFIKYDKTTAVIESTGKITLAFYSNLKIACQSDFHNFPFDSQSCKLRFCSHANAVSKLRFVPATIGQNIDLDKIHPEWTVNSYTLDHSRELNVSRELENKTEIMQFEIIYQLKMYRRPSFYMLTIALPNFIMTTIALVAIFAPSGSNKLRKNKISIGLAVIFALTLELNVVAVFLFRSASSPPLLSAFILYELILIGIATLTTTSVCIINQIKMTSVKQPPDWLSSILLVPNDFIRDLYGSVNFWQYTHRQSSFVEPIPNKPPKFGVKVLPTTSITSQNMEKVYQKLDYLTGEIETIRSLKERRNAEERRRLKWNIIFDRIEIAIFVLFFIAHCAMTAVLFIARP